MQKLAGLLLLLAGCGPATGHVVGTVTYRGAVLPSGTVSFFTASAVVQGEIADGRYDVAGVPTGEARVTIVRLDPAQPDPNQALNDARKKVVQGQATDPREVDPKVVVDAGRLAELNKK